MNNESEFSNMMTCLHQEMVDQLIHISARPIRMAFEVARKFNIQCILIPPPIAEIGNYRGSSLIGHVFRWCDENYSKEQQSIGYDLGMVIIKIRGDLWPVKVPAILMHNGLVIALDVSKEKIYQSEQGTAFNLAHMINGLPRALATSLSMQEIGLDQVHLLGHAFHVINSLCFKLFSLPMVTESIQDFVISGKFLMENNGSYGISKWHSLQFVEKILKAYLHTKAISLKKTHNLSVLTAETERVGLPTVNQTDIKLIQCDPGVRYGDPIITKDDAFLAHHASIRVAYHIVNNIR